MDLSKFMPNFKTQDDSDEEPLSPFEYHQQFAPKHGPSKPRFMTNGQVSRAIERQRKTQKRKMNLRHRRVFFGNQRAMAVLYGQLQIAGVFPLYDGTYVPETHPSRERVITALTANYGSVTEAAEVYGRVLADSE